MLNMAIDMGNTRVKAGLFSNQDLKQVLVDPSIAILLEMIRQEQVEKVVISSVGSDPSLLEEQLRSIVKVIRLRPDQDVPVDNQYHTPQTLGMDRLAAVVGAHHCYSDSNCLVIDAGTSITYDFVDKHGKYYGGGIAPGIYLRFKSLHDYTDKLPLVSDRSEPVSLIGMDTESAIRSGVLNGVCAEIEGIIRRYQHKFPNLRVLLCGGDATFFESMLKAPIFVVPHLVLIGLNTILMYHAQGR